MEIKPEHLDILIRATDYYATKCAHRQKHIESDFKIVASAYARATGCTKKAAADHLRPILVC